MLHQILNSWENLKIKIKARFENVKRKKLRIEYSSLIPIKRYGLSYEKTCLLGFQPGHTQTSLPATETSKNSEISLILFTKGDKYYQYYADAQGGLHLCCLQTTKDRFSRVEAHMVQCMKIRYLLHMHKCF